VAPTFGPDGKPSSVHVARLDADYVADAIRRMPGARPAHAAPLGGAFFRASDAFFRQAETTVAPSLGFQATQAAQFECRVWCVTWLDRLAYLKRQPESSLSPCLTAIGSLVAAEYEHRDSELLAAVTTLVWTRRDEYAKRIIDKGDPVGWFLQCLMSACQGKPRTADSPLILGNPVKEFVVTPAVWDLTTAFMDTAEPLFRDTPDFAQMPLSEFSARAISVGL
jgi:hypothetical protein